MKILLIQTPWSGSSAREFKNISRRFAFYPPLGLLCLAAFVEKHGHQADVLDLEASPLSFPELCDRILSSKADMVGFTASTPVFSIVQAYAKALKEKLRLPIIVGGIHMTVLKDQAFTSEFDFGITHEGEQTLLELINELQGAKNFSKIQGLIYREGDTVHVNPPRPFIADLDSLPFPARHKLDIYKYSFEVPGKGRIPVATVELTRGCPFQCVFCSEPLNTGRRLRVRSAQHVLDEMLEIRDQFNIHHFFMLDSTLTVNRKLIEDFCNLLIEKKTNITFEGQTRADLIDEPLLTLMKQAGLVRLSFGFESANENVLKLMKKQLKPESVREAFRLCKKLKISSLCGAMMGNPGDTRKTILENAWFVRSIPEIRYAPLAIAVPYPGTELLEIAQKGMYGLKLVETDFRKYSRYAGGVMEVDGMKPAELMRLQRKALIIMHSTPSKVIGLIQHFGFWNLVNIALKMLRDELIRMLGGSELVLRDIENENTTLKSLGLISDMPSKSKSAHGKS